MSNSQYTSINNTSDAYERKIYRLQSQNIGLREELETVKYKLRNMEDIQLKYQLLLGQSQNQNNRLKLNQIQLQNKLTLQIQLITRSKDQQYRQKSKKADQQHKQQILTLRQRHQQQKQQLNQEYEELKKLYQTISSKASQMQIFSFKLKKYERQVQQLQDQILSQKNVLEQNKQKQLAQLKLSLTKKFKNKYDNQIQSYENKNRQLSKKIDQIQLQKDLLEEKLKTYTVSDECSNISKLKEIINQRKSIQKDQISRMQQALDKSNNSLRAMIQQKYQSEQKHLATQNQLKNYIKELQNQLFDQQKAHTKQIYNLKQKMNLVREQQIITLKQHNQQLRDNFEKQKSVWDNLSNQHGDEIKNLRQSYDRLKEQAQRQKYNLKLKIKDLKQRLNDHEGKRLDGQTQQMISSLKDVDNRQDSLAKYQNGVIFLQRQLKKVNIKLDEKNKQITKLLTEVSEIRSQSQNQLIAWKDKYKKQKKQFMDRILLLENQVRDLSDKIRIKQRQLQKNCKESAFQRLQLEKQIQTLKDINQQLKRDYDRAISTTKTLQNQYRSERDKGVSTKGDVTYLKRIKWLQLQKQKNDLDIIFRQKQQQLKIIYQKQIDELTTERNNLKHKVALLEDEKNRLVSQNEQLIKKQQNKQNISRKELKKKSGQMEKKLASLNLQIGLTKNLFQNLQKAKSRLKQRDFTQRNSSVDNQQNQEDFD